jgi:hypothetical protein
MSWRWVERPFRQKGFLTRRSVFTIAVFTSIFFIGLGILGNETHGFRKVYFKYRLSKEQQYLADYIGYNKSAEFKAAYRYGTCFYGGELGSFDYFNKGECLKFAKGKKNYLIFGDSHGAQLYAGLVANFPGINFMQATSSGCRPLLSMQGEKRCTDLTAFIFNDFLPHNQIDGVIYAGRWEDQQLDDILATVTYLETLVPRIYIMGPIAEYKVSLPQLLLRLKPGNGTEALQGSLLPERFALSEKMKKQFKGHKAIFVPTIEAACPGGNCLVYAEGTTPLSWDYGHFTKAGSELVIKSLKESGALVLE